MSRANGISVSETGLEAISANQTVYAILGAICFCHFLNDMTQSMISACYPMFKDLYHLDYSQIGLITLTYSDDRLPAATGGRVRIPIAARSRFRCRSAWDSPWSGWCCFPGRTACT